MTAFVEPFVIVAILIVNATVGVMQESSAEKAVEALKEYESDQAATLRDGKIALVDAGELVPGDIVEIEAGSRIPADIRVIELQAQVKNSSLNTSF
jgi:P-type E1-E2 ATPase